MNKNIIINPIRKENAIQIAILSGQLGYTISGLEIANQIETINAKDDHFAFAAFIEENLVAYIHAFISYRLTSKAFVEICGLVVDENYKRYGIGKALVNHIEGMAKQDMKLRVRCNINREEAHKFYSNLNFKHSKNQHIFEK